MRLSHAFWRWAARGGTAAIALAGGIQGAGGAAPASAAATSGTP